MFFALLALTGSAMAQSSGTLFGVVDAGITHIASDGLGNKNGMSSGGNIPGRLGLRGVEDLGGGLSASFWLEPLLAIDAGNSAGLASTRRATVSLSSPLGELRLGRDFSPIWRNISLPDPFAARGVGTSQAFNNFGYNAIYNRNTVGYVLPAALGGFYGQAQYAFDGKASTAANDKAGDFFGGRFGYAKGPINVAVSYGEWKQVVGASDTTTVAIGSDLTMANLVASWDFGVVKSVVLYEQEKLSGAASAGRIDALLVGLTAPIGMGEIKLTAACYDLKNSGNDFSKLALRYAHALSKRTVL